MLGYDPKGSRPFLTSRMAAGKTGVGYVTVSTMARGHRASKDKIRKFAAGVRGDAEKLLMLTGYIPETDTYPDLPPLTREREYTDNERDYGELGGDNHPATPEGVEAAKRHHAEHDRIRDEINLGEAGKSQAALIVSGFCIGQYKAESATVLSMDQSNEPEFPYLVSAQIQYKGGALGKENFLVNLETHKIKEFNEGLD